MDSFDIFFSKFGLFDFIDILLVAILLYLFFSLIRGTIAVNILVGYVFVYLFYLLVRSLNMRLLTNLLNGFFQVGVLALIVIFQQEIRKFFLIIGSNFKRYRNQYWYKFFSKGTVTQKQIQFALIKPILDASRTMQESRTGALIIITKNYEDESFYRNGEEVNADISKRLLESIFSKTSPLHDGAVVISENKIKAASCILPLTDNAELPVFMGLRHRAALGITEISDVGALVISEETGNISYAKQGKIRYNITLQELEKSLTRDFF